MQGSDTTRATAPPNYARGFALGICAYLIGVHLWTWVFFGPGFWNGNADFRQLYSAGYLVRSGRSHLLYDPITQHQIQDEKVSKADIALPFNHLAYEALLFAPFSILNYKNAYFAFLGFNIVLLIVTFQLLHSQMRHLAQIYASLPAASFLAFLPIAAALMQGQDSIILLTLFVASLICVGKRADLQAGMLVGLGLFKFQLTLPIGLLFLVWRRWRFCAGLAISGTVAFVLSLWLTGVAQTLVYLHSLISMSAGLVSETDQFKYGISPTAMPNLRGVIFGLAHTSLSPLWLQVLVVTASCAILSFVAICGERFSVVHQINLAILASVLVSYHLLIHDLSVLLIPVVLTIDRFTTAGSASRGSEGALLSAAVALFISPLLISFSPSHFYLVSLPILVLLTLMLTDPGAEVGSAEHSVHAI